MRRAVVISALAAGILGGCGPSSYGEFRNQLASRWCDYEVRCGRVGVHDLASCAPPAALLSTIPTFDVENEIGSHRLQFHPDNASWCLDAVKKLPCDDAQAAADLARRCHGIVTAAAPTGATCFADEECVGGACVRAGDGCSGTCVPWAPPGSACVPSGGAPDVTCDPTVHYCDGVCKHKGKRGAACSDDSQCLFDWVCVDGKCADPPRLAAGDVCGTQSPPCKDGLYCDETGTCAARKTSGEACTRVDACADGLVCVGGTCGPWLDAGQACMPAMPSGCPATETCTNGACASGALPHGPHQACKADGDCASGLYCNGFSCEYQRGALGPCTADAGCQSGLSCDAATQTCRLPVSCPAAM